MKKFKTEIDNSTNDIRFIHTEEGFYGALLVHIQDGVDYDGHVETWKEVISPDDFKKVKAYYENGTSPANHSYEWNQSFYWCARRINGKLYPLPLIYSDATERKEAADKRNAETWRMFYAGRINNDQLQEQLVDCPTCEEVEALRLYLNNWASQGESPWDEFDQRGGHTPRWAA